MSNETTSVAHADELAVGPYKLGAVIRRSPAAAVYETEFCDRNRGTHPAVIKIRELDPAAASAAVRQWRGAMRLDHPHLLHIYDAGTSELNGATAAWAVIERADESLTRVLDQRALSEDEVGAVLRPAADALAYLHRNGYAHGALTPSDVLAIGDQLKLSCDNAIRVSDGGVPAEDIRALGALILEALTERGSNSVVHHPSGRFSELVRHCTDPDPAKRWTAEQLAEYLGQKDAAPSPKTAPASAEPQLAGRIRKPSRPFPKWIFAGLAAVVLIVLLAAVMRTTNTKPASLPPPPVTSIAPEIAPSPPVVQAEPAPAKPEPFPGKPHAANRKADGWSVIVAAYNSRDAAEKKMNTLAKRWTAFHLQVSEHSSERAPWLVTVGDNLSEDQAQTLRGRAVHAGLARDAYIKRIK